jgi:hypothetical protein
MCLGLHSFWTVRATAILLAGMALLGCQSSSISTTKLVASQSRLDFDGLESTKVLNEVAVTGAAPRSWNQLALETNPIYTHTQWRSPTGNTGVGIVYVHLPLPIAPATLLWLAEQHFASMPGEDGHFLGRWTDILGRSWFTAQNSHLHLCGYVITEGSCAWIVYYGYKLNGELHPSEMSIAARSVQSVMPMTELHDPAGPNVAEVPRPHLATTE